MRAKTLAATLLGGFVLVSLVALGVQSRGTSRAADPATSDAPTSGVASKPAVAHRVVVTYFYGDVRCPTCRKLEALSREAVEQGFAMEIAAGTVVFQAINVDRAENKHFVADYKLVTKSLIVADEREGKPGRWLNLEKIWDLVGNHDCYMTYVRGTVRDLLDAA